jgi:hypothetical protein
VQDLGRAVYTARHVWPHRSFAALSDLTWFNMWRGLEQRQIRRPNYTKQLCLARLEGQPDDCGALIRIGLGKHYFLCVELKLHQLNQFYFAPLIPGDWDPRV